MKHLHYALLVTAIAFSSCRNNDAATVQANPGNVVPFWQQSSPAVQDQSTQPSGIQNSNLEMGTPTLPGMNPPHGQPGHRCDIPDGAPLNTPVNGAVAGQAITSQPLQLENGLQPTAAKTVTPKGMNPPHGETNHRCDIAVGAPLNSKPTSTATTATTTANSGQETKEYTVNQAVPALLSTAAADTETPAGMNPAHGKTGHRCDIAVGAPLPKS